ncbi:MAG: hypothetical protein HKN11_04065 [Rhizobiales bacterium]|nr:hypothetical protein [Hyphomicrobiales bacterium]
MSEQWNYQLRLVLEDAPAEIARRDMKDPVLAPLAGVLDKHNTILKCQYDAFADYVAECEKHGQTDNPLYPWTRDTIANPLKKAKYIKAFTLYIDGDETYAKDKADALESDLQPLVGGDIVVSMAKHDTNPANNPQAPAKYRK